jgi:hypothetical protein
MAKPSEKMLESKDWEIKKGKHYLRTNPFAYLSVVIF